MAPIPPNEAFELQADDEPTARAQRIAGMLDRWAAEDVSDEPAWEVEDIEPMRLRSAGHEGDGRRKEP